MPWAVSADYETMVSDFLKKNKTTLERVGALNEIASDIYSKDFEYISYLMLYADGKDAKKAEQLMPYIQQSNLADIFGLTKLEELGPVIDVLRTYITDLPDPSIHTIGLYDGILTQLQDSVEAQIPAHT